MIRRSALSALLGAACVAAARPARAADSVSVGMLRLPTQLFVGIEKGFFASENIDVKPVFFRSGAELVPALSTGQIDIASTSPGAALFNAIERGVNAKIVADYWTSGKDHPSGDSAYITVRKDLVADGKFKTARDAKGMTLAITAHGQMTELFATAYLQSVGLNLSDLRVVDLPLPDMVAALANKAVDLATTIDPYATLAAQRGVGDKMVPLSAVLPGYVQAVMMYGDRPAKHDRALGMRFMRAFSKANLYLRRALAANGGRAEIAQIYQKWVPLENAAIYERIGLAVGPENLAVDIDGQYALRWQMDQYVRSNEVQHAPDLRGAVDNSFADAARAR